MAKPFKTSKSLIFYLSTVVLMVFFIYSFSLTRSWQPFDESLIYKEEFLPIPTSFTEIFEIINSFVLKAHILSMNSFFSNHVTLRSDPLAWSILVFIFFFFKKNAILYHLFQLFIHVTNCVLVFLILRKTTLVFDDKKTLTNFDYLITSILTLIWGLHSANSEAILLSTNWNALLIYSFCFGFLLYEVQKITQNNLNLSLPEKIFIPLLFFITMSIAEFAYTFPVILFFILSALSLKAGKTIKHSIKASLTRTIPYFLGLGLFSIYMLIKLDSSLMNLVSAQKSFYFFLERNMWLTPQIFVHFIKLLFFPKTLSTFQSNLIHLSDTFTSPYSIFCFFCYVIFLMIPFLLLILFRRAKNISMCPLIYAFYFSLFPFLHIITPTYCLIADRYCYLPSFTLLIFISSIIYLPRQKKSKLLLLILSCILLIITSRTFIRIQDWKNPVSFYNSVLKAEKKSLFRGEIFLVIADFLSSQNLKTEMQTAIQRSSNEFDRAFQELKALREKYQDQPATLKIYGLDYDSLLLKAAYGISIIKNTYLKESPKEILQFLEPYINKRLDFSAPNEITLYADLLLKSGESEKAKYVYEYLYKKYPFILEANLSLANLYLDYEKNPDKAFIVLQNAYKYYPNKGMPMYKLLKYYEYKKDFINQAKYAYLLGLRDHSIESYQNAAQIYLDLTLLQPTKKTLDKLMLLNQNNPLTLLQLSRYLDITGDRKNILEILNKAYLLNKTSNINETYITKAILVSLINVNFKLSNIEASKKYLNELEAIKDLSKEDISQINSVKETLLRTN